MILLFNNLRNIFKMSCKKMCNLVISKLPNNENFQKLFTPELVTLSSLFSKYNYELRIAGGAVRDLIMNKLPSDIDFATTATPEEMKIMFEQEQIRLIKTNGEKHGTITCRINDKENFEVTTLRIDMETDGRHAKVKFTKDWKLDAERRDLTINSLFLDFDGMVYDFFGGIDDLFNKRIRFVGNADARIKEDYLRILRYFRFYGRIAENPNSHEELSLLAMKSNAEGLKGISGERIWVELKKILLNRFADSMFKKMQELGITEYLGLTEELNLKELEKVHQHICRLKPNPMTLITALFTQKSQLESLHKRVKLSNAELQISNFILEYRTKFLSHKDRYKYLPTSKVEKPLNTDTDSSINSNNLTSLDDPLFDLCCDIILDPSITTQGLLKTKSSIEELLKYVNAINTLEKLKIWQPPKFPVDGTKLIEIGIPKGPKFSIVLKRLRDKWREGRYIASEEELLEPLKKDKKYLNL